MGIFYGIGYSISEREGAIAQLNDRVRDEFVKYLSTSRARVVAHNNLLGHYFRHLYHTVSYIAAMDDAIVPEEQNMNMRKWLGGRCRIRNSCYYIIILYLYRDEIGM